MTENEQAMYTGMAISRNTEVTLRWSRSQMFILLHSAALTFFASRPLSRLHLLLAFGGFLMAVLWWFTIWRTEHWVEYWQSRLRAVEKSQESPVQTYVYEGPEFQSVSSRLPSFHQILLSLPVLAGMIWFTLLVITLALL